MMLNERTLNEGTLNERMLDEDVGQEDVGRDQGRGLHRSKLGANMMVKRRRGRKWIGVEVQLELPAPAFSTQ